MPGRQKKTNTFMGDVDLSDDDDGDDQYREEPISEDEDRRAASKQADERKTIKECATNPDTGWFR